MEHYRPSIPKAARERILATFINSRRKYKAEYILHGKVVGIRFFHETGDLQSEFALKNGLKHGIEYRSDIPGRLLSAEPYSNGLPHGIARQWSDDGKLIGTYTMKRGTGIDLWWCDHNGSPVLSEVRYLKAGKWHGFEWWLDEDQKSVWQECHFQENRMHGIERSWNQKGTLQRGYPRYWINDRRVSRRQYLRECLKDKSLPRFRQNDNRPRRAFPAEVKSRCNLSINK
jgi:hypothetical protein